MKSPDWLRILTASPRQRLPGGVQLRLLTAQEVLEARREATALAGEENLRVLGAVWTEETRTLTVELEWQGEPMQAVLDAAALGWQDRQEDRQEAGSI